MKQTLDEGKILAQSEALFGIVAPLLSWYDRNARILPWREEPTPYRVWISEIMLQQTRVEAVKPYFERFVSALPDVCDLARVPDDQLMKLWEGLGYYSRARNLKKAAGVLMECYGGALPASFDALLTLPGIGSYTAGAVASIAYGLPVPAVDGNVLRVISRLLASEEDITKPIVKKTVERSLTAVLPKDRPGDFNQALMELGATVCLPNGVALCEQCPVQGCCKAHREGRVMELPVKAKKKPRREEERTVLLLFCEGKVAVRQREKKGLLAGLWELPNMEGRLAPVEAEERLEEWGFSGVRAEPLCDAKHIFSHIEWHMTGYAAYVREERTANGLTWVTREQLAREIALPSAFRAYTEELFRRLP